MKKLLVVLVMVLFGTMSYAQWFGGPGNLYMTGGNVGIGTSTPASRLVIESPSAVADFILQRPLGTPAGNNPVGQFRMLNTGSGDYFNFSFRYNLGNSEVVQSAFQAATSTTRAFIYFNVGTGKFEMRNGVVDIQYLNSGKISFDNSGAIGIGMGTTAIPAGAKVAINGKVVCKEIEVTLTAMPPDYVFGNDYKLLSLYDVENFINSNKHLPGVPSGTEISKGLNVGDMNMTLLQKVEELTLYMINLQKENDALKARINRLEK